MLALSQGLESLGKQVDIFLPEEIPTSFAFLSGLDRVLRQLPDRRYDVLVTLECPTVKRLPKGFELSRFADFVVNFDHHPDNENYGNVVFCDCKAAALGELTLDALLALGVRITKEIATAIYVAILTDTGSFQYSRVTGLTHQRLACLLDAGVDTDMINREVYRSGQANTLKLIGHLLSQLKYEADHPAKVVWSQLSLADLEKFQVPAEETGFFVDELDRIGGSEVILFLRQAEPDLVKISLRSRGRAINQVAARFGGGGHSKAAGCRIAGSLDHARQLVLEALAQDFA
jgi:phosphoesterase RecJ-like protein